MNDSTTLSLARDIMTTDVVTLPAAMTVVDATRLLLEEEVSNAPVVEHDMSRDILIGFVSEKDCMQCYADGVFYERPGVTVKEIMRPHPVSVREETDVYALAAIFMQHGFRHVPVTVGGILRGMVSRRDVLAALVEHYRDWSLAGEDADAAPDLRSIFTPRYIIG